MERNVSRPNVLDAPAKTSSTSNTSTVTTGNKWQVPKIDDIKTLADIVQKNHKIDIFLESFLARNKNNLPFATEEICNEAVSKVWRAASVGHSNPLWVAASNKRMQAIIARFFVINNNHVIDDKSITSNVSILDKSTSEYWTRSFGAQGVTDDKLTELAEMIENTVTKRDLSILGNKRLFDSGSRSFILKFFGEERLDKVFAPQEIADFLTFLVQFVVLD
jgi:hypothetical protein